MGYDIDFIDMLEELVAEVFFLAEEALKDLFCRFCHRKTVHRLCRENPDGGVDEVGLKCRKCHKLQ
jgi:hypothetical protein